MAGLPADQALTIGADPELFLKKGKRLISSIGLIGGTKRFPKPLGVGNGYAVQEDNVAVEFNIPPAVSKDAFVSSISYALDEIRALVTPIGLTMHLSASEKFPDSQLRDPRARMFGCEPDYNAWANGEVNPKPQCRSKRFRSSGGHVHFGYPEKMDGRFRLRLIQSADMFLGVPSILLDEDKKRRQLYGKAGCFRKTNYGAEYRTLSNFWLKDPKLTAWVYDGAQRAYTFAKQPDNWVLLDSEQERIIRCINRSDAELAEELVNEYQIPVCT